MKVKNRFKSEALCIEQCDELMLARIDWYNPIHVTNKSDLDEVVPALPFLA